MRLTEVAERARAASRRTALTALTIAIGAVSGLSPASAAADSVVGENQIVQGSQCVGFDCVNGESFGFATQILKQNNLRILFNDDSNSPFPTENWGLIANSTESGGPSYFGLADLGETETNVENPAIMPFQVMAGAPDKALSIAANGDVGIGSGDVQSAGAVEQNADPARQNEPQSVNDAQILNQVAALPLSTWAYQGDAAGGRHIGPSAADFNGAFGLGPATPYVAPADIGGVALASIQALKSSFDAQSGKTDSAIQGLNSAIQRLTTGTGTPSAGTPSAGTPSAGTARALRKIRRLRRWNRSLKRRLDRLERAVFHK